MSDEVSQYHTGPLPILLDVDGVLADFVSAAVKIGNELAGTSYTAADITDWRMFSLPGLREVESEIWDRINEPGFMAALNVFEGTKQAVQKLKKLGDVAILSTPLYRSTTAPYERYVWLFEHFGIEWKDVVYAYRKDLVRGLILVDDKPENIESWCLANPDGYGVLWDRPYNSTCSPPKNAERSSNWNDVLEIVKNARG